jgi:DNA-binding transcriptional LysR family regulator
MEVPHVDLSSAGLGEAMEKSLGTGDCFEKTMKPGRVITEIGTMHKSGLTELEVVLAVARRQGFRAASVELEMSGTAVSNAVAGLEARLGTRLFHRTTRSVSLTEAGQRFVDAIGPAVGRIQDALDTVAQAGDRDAQPTGTLRINSSLGAALMAFQPVLLAFLRRHPGMSVDLVTDGRMVDIVAEGFDAGLRPSARVPRDMIRVPLTAETPMAVVGSPGYFEHRPQPRKPADLARHACIRARLPSGVPSPWEFTRAGKTQRVDVPGPLVLDTPLLMREAALHGLGLAQVAAWYVADDIAAGRLVRVLDAWTAPGPGLSLYYAGHRHVPPGLRALIALIHEARN